MLIIGCDYHPGFRQIAVVNTEAGEFGERRLSHREEAEQFYRELKQPVSSVRVGMKASGHARWFERMLNELQFELWIGDAAEIRTKRVRKKKTDRKDAQLLLRLMMEDRFPRIWVPDAANRDLRQLRNKRLTARVFDARNAACRHCGTEITSTRSLRSFSAGGWCSRKVTIHTLNRVRSRTALMTLG